ncbi:MAG: hypothetical protein AAFS10_22785, partial [Myxococcota bacterium]
MKANYSEWVKRMGAVAMAATLVSCGSDESSTSDVDGSGESNATTGEAALTWYRDIKPTIDSQCVGCHTTGGVAPFALTTYEEFKPMASAAVAS